MGSAWFCQPGCRRGPDAAAGGLTVLCRAAVTAHKVDRDGSNAAGRHRSNYRNRRSHSRRDHRSRDSRCRDGNKDHTSKKRASRSPGRPATPHSAAGNVLEEAAPLSAAMLAGLASVMAEARSGTSDPTKRT